jgi:pyrroline-5-carboxylate reductase
MSKTSPDKIDELRETFQSHLSSINQRVNETMVLLSKLPEVARKFYFELPTWAPKPKVLVSVYIYM